MFKLVCTITGLVSLTATIRAAWVGEILVAGWLAVITVLQLYQALFVRSAHLHMDYEDHIEGRLP